MKKNTIKAFTLVEMLIVIVIIGILIAALMPRMQSAQWRARDVSRKNSLAQIQTAIITSQQDKWKWPNLTWAVNWTWIQTIVKELTTAWMSSVPTDPLTSNKVFGMWNINTWSLAPISWNFLYLVASRNGTTNAGFVLMAKTEVEWWSNWVYCWQTASQWYITWGTDISKLQTCTTFNKTWTNTCSVSSWTCNYSDDWMLRYILLY
jgi:prepilin-type N-terminal cleavage/methylation domain-containing protein